MPNATATSIQIQANLSEQYLYVQDAPIAPGPLDRFVSVFDGSVSHLLTVDSSGQMLHFMPDQNSQSGWNVSLVDIPVPPNGTNMLSIRAFVASGQLNAIVLFEAVGGYAVSWKRRTGPGSWTGVLYPLEVGLLLTLVTQLNSYTDANDNTCVYGVAPADFVPSEQFFVLLYDQSQDMWNVVYQEPVSAMTNLAAATTEFHIIPKTQDPNHNIQVVWISQNSQNASATFAGGVLDSGQFSLTSSEEWQHVQMPNMDQPHIIPFPGQSFPGFFLVLDAAGNLYLVIQSPGGGCLTLNDKWGPSNIAAVSLSQINGLGVDQVVLFAIEEGTNSLWIARQNASDPLPDFFGNWSNLGSYAEAIAAPESVPGGAEVYFADATLNVFHLAQNPTDAIWASRKIAAPVAPSDTPQKVSAIMMHATVLDENGNPVPNAEISVAADQWANIVVNEFSYTPGPGATISIQADAAGTADVFYPASSLAMPTFTFTSGSAQNCCQADVVGTTATPVNPSSIANRLAGNDSIRPINQTTLQNANLVAPNTDPTPYIQAINQLGQAMLKQSCTAGSLDVSSMTLQHWRLDFTGTNATFRVLTAEEGAALLRNSQAGNPAPAGIVGDFISDLFGDAVSFFTNVTTELESVAVSVVDNVFNVILNGVSYVAKTARQIAAVVQMIFAKIAEGLADVYTIIKEVIALLEMLFHWEDVLATHRVFKACVNSFFDTAEKSVEDIRPLVAAQISYVQQNLAQAVTQLRQQLGSQTFNEYANGLQPPGISAPLSSNVLDAEALRDAYEQNLSRCWYVYNKCKNHFGLPSRPGASSSSVDLTPLLTQVADSWGSSAVNFTQQVQQLVASMPQGFTSFSNLLDLGIDSFLQLTEDFAQLLLTGLEAIVMAILDLIDAALQGFQGQINASIDIPLISWLYKYVITATPLKPGDDLTILDLLCLIFAVPITILYKLLHENNAPFSSGDADYINQDGLAWPVGSQKAPAAGTVPTPLYMALGICGGLLYLPTVGLGSILDGLSFTEEPPQNLVAAASYAGAIGVALRQTLVAPWSLWAAGSSWTVTDKFRTTLWSAGALAALVDLTFVFVTKAMPQFGEDLGEFQSAGPIIAGAMGIVLGGIGFITFWLELESSGKKYSGWDMANDLVPPCLRIPKLLILLKDDEEAAPFALAGLLACDVALGYGSFATQSGAAVSDWVQG